MSRRRGEFAEGFAVGLWICGVAAIAMLAILFV